MVRMPINVLVVDDEEDFVEMFTLRLSETGKLARGALSGREALKILAEEGSDVDVVILDIRMPGMDGIETLREIKRRFPLVEVILLTGHGSVDSAVTGMKLGAFDYLNKPADFGELDEKLEKARGRKADHEDRISRAQGRAMARRTGDMF